MRGNNKAGGAEGRSQFFPGRLFIVFSPMALKTKLRGQSKPDCARLSIYLKDTRRRRSATSELVAACGAEIEWLSESRICLRFSI